MPVRLSTTVNKISSLSNSVSASLVMELYEYMRSNGSSESHINNTLKTNMLFAEFLGKELSFYDVRRKDQITSFLDTKIKSQEVDLESKWITTWNDYLGDVKFFLRWLHNWKLDRDGKEKQDVQSPSEWETPTFAMVRKKKTKRVSPYLENDLWERDEIGLVIKYEPFKRNKAALALMWDLDARNHEITLLSIKHIRLKEKYGEGEIPHQAKTGSGPILLTFSYPYVRDWLNEHPFRNEPEARLICNLYTGSAVKPEVLWGIMKQLRKRIQRLLSSDSIKDQEERVKLDYILKTRKFNPYCLRHSAITNDSDYLPEYALKKKCRWSMNSRQGNRYIKSRMGNDLKQKILTHNGISSPEEFKKQPSILSCPRCEFVNAMDNKYCSKCYYPLSPSAFDEIKEAEDLKIKSLEEKHQEELDGIRNQFNLLQSQMQTLISIISSIGGTGKNEIARTLIQKRIYNKT